MKRVQKWSLWRRSNKTINVLYVCVLSLCTYTLSALIDENQNVLIFSFHEFLFDRFQLWLTSNISFASISLWWWVYSCGYTQKYFLLLIHILYFVLIYFVCYIFNKLKCICLTFLPSWRSANVKNLPTLWNVKLEEYSNKEEKRKQYEILLQFFLFYFPFFLNTNAYDVKSNKSPPDEDILRNDLYNIKMQMTID